MGNCKSCAGHNDEEIGVDDLQGMKTNESSMNVGAKIHDVSYGQAPPAKVQEDKAETFVASPELIKAVIKMQSVYRGHRSRRLVKILKRETPMRLTDEEFGYSVEGNYENEVVRQKIQALGQFEAQETPRGEENETAGVKLEYRKMQQCQTYSKYMGQWIEGTEIRQGQGQMVWKDGTTFDGQFLQNKLFGKGRLILPSGDVYEGDWKNDQASGYGVYICGDGAKYEGDWLMDKKHGYGKEIWPDGASYNGEYQNGMKHGKGMFTWEDGNTYEGQFKENNMQGPGAYKWNDGRQYDGAWVNNKQNGFGVFTWPDGKKYEGDYVNDVKQGQGTFYWPNGKFYKGEFKNGKMDGQGTYTNEKGKVKTGLWKDGHFQKQEEKAE